MYICAIGVRWYALTRVRRSNNCVGQLKKKEGNSVSNYEYLIMSTERPCAGRATLLLQSVFELNYKLKHALILYTNKYRC